MARKTFEVNQLILQVNDMCKESTCSPDVRQGMMNLLENVLHETGNYRGFRYLLQDQVPAGEKPGVNYDVSENGTMVPHPDYEKRFANTDRTRVYYFF